MGQAEGVMDTGEPKSENVKINDSELKESKFNNNDDEDRQRRMNYYMAMRDD